MNDTKYNVFDFALHEVTNESISLSDNERKADIKNLDKVLDNIITQMKKGETFNYLYKNKEYRGSSYENLKITKPNEFDINLLFVWPANACKVVYDRKQPGYVKLKIDLENPTVKKMRGDAPTFDRILSKWIDKEGFLSRSTFKSWMQGIVAKALEAVSDEDTQIRQSTSGAGITLKIYQQTMQLNYSVDLVAAFLFTQKDWPVPPVRPLSAALKKKEWSVVPEEPKTEKEPVYWRMSFYQQEEALMSDRLAMKSIIKLIKLLRDKENWSNDLYSYAIKTVFLWECDKTNIAFWKKGLGTLFVYMLQKLSDVYLTRGEIPYYWDKNLNLIEKIKESTRDNLKGRICAILKVIDSNVETPYAIKSYFGCGPEKKQHISSEFPIKSDPLIDLSSEEIDTPLLTNSSIVSPPSSQYLLECETKPEIEKVNLGEHGTVEFNNKGVSEARDDVDSPSAIELLRTIIKEQQEMKQTLQSMLLQFNELSKEVRDLQQENTCLKQQLQNSKTENTSKISSPIESMFKNLKISQSFNNGKLSPDKSQVSTFQRNSSPEFIVFENEIPESTNDKDNETNNKDNQFSHLLPSDFGQK